MPPCKLILKPNRAIATSKRQADLIKELLRQNIEKGLVPAHEKNDRARKIDTIAKPVRVILKVKKD